MKLRDARIVKCAIEGMKIADIAAAEGVSIRQIHRRLAKGDVRDAIDAAGRAMTRAATIRLQRGAASAADALVGMADGTVAPSPGRAAAAGKVVDSALRAVEVEHLLSRLLELEVLIAEREKGGGWES